MIRIYALVWVLLVAGAGLLYYTGQLNDLAVTVFGFIFATQTFMGFVTVLPWWVDRRYSWKY